MAKMMHLLVVSLLVCMGAVSCRTVHEAHAVSGASTQAEGKMILPPEADTYTVLGVRKGLKKFMVKYDDQVYRGGDPYSNDAAVTLREAGIRTIISITPTDREREFCKQHGFELVEIPFTHEMGPLPGDLHRFLGAIRAGKGAFYVHCHGGTHRGGVLGVAYRVMVLKWSYEKALVEFGRLGGDLLADHVMLEAVRKVK